MTEKQWEIRRKIEDLFREITKSEDDEERKELRKWMFFGLIEMFSTWRESGDCLPEIVFVGGKKYRFVEV